MTVDKQINEAGKADMLLWGRKKLNYNQPDDSRESAKSHASTLLEEIERKELQNRLHTS